MLFYFDKTQKIVGGGGLTFHNSKHRLALGHVNDLRCLGKVHAPSNYRRPEFEIPQAYLSRCQSFIYDVRVHLGRLFCVSRCQSFIYNIRMHLGRLFCVIFSCKSPAIYVSS